MRSTSAERGPLGAHNPEVTRLRALLRDHHARDDRGLFVCEGPRLVDAALDAGVALGAVYLGADASDASRTVAARAEAAGVDVRTLAPGVAARVADTRTSQGLFALAPLVRLGAGALAGADLVCVATTVSDPGNAGTLVRGAAAAGAQAVVLGRGSVDAYNPKVVRASAGACFAVRIVEGVPAVEILEALVAVGVSRLGAYASGGRPPESFDLTAPTAFVLGHEARGLTRDVPLDGAVTIPMRRGESLNLAMAGTVLLFEAARQRRLA